MSRFLLALRCFFAVLFYFRLPKDAVALLPPPALGPITPEPPAPLAPPEPVLPPAPARAAPAVEAAPVEAPAARPAPAAEPPAAPAPALAVSDEVRRRGAVQMLALLQREGRLIDFLMEEVDAYADAQIGAAARDIHRGCRKGLLEHVKVAPVRPEPDEAAVRVEEGYDPSAVRLIGNLTGRPPFHGTLRHHGWRAKDVLLPDLPPSHDPQVITPAEVELGG
jgi:hypothetical protein